MWTAPCIGRLVTGQRRDRLLKLAALHDVEHASHRLRLQEGLPADEDIVLGEQADEIEAELPRRGLDAEG